MKQTKHYYMGAQRVASQAGYLGPRNIHVESPHDPVFSNLREVRAEIKERTKDTPIGQITIEPDPFETLDEIEDIFGDLDLGTNVPDNLRPRVLYWYHPDYIGNVDMITDQTGFVYQFFMYNPCSRADLTFTIPQEAVKVLAAPNPDQSLVEHREGENLYEYDAGSGDYDSPYRFNAKELDPETGNYYYGARYYDPKISVWLSVDPMSSAAPGWTPYRFCFNNPVNIVDPTGLLEDDYKLDKKTGEISLIRETDDDFDVLYATDDDGNVDESKSLKVNDRSVLPSLSKKDAENYTTKTLWGDKVGSWAKTNSSSDAYGVFKFASDNSDVEWGLQQYSGNRFVLGTSHFSESVGGLNKVSGYDILDLQIDYHSHPGSGAPVDDVASGMMGDQGYASGIVRTFLKNGVDYKNHPQFRIYRPHVAKPYRFNYSPWKTKFNSIAVGSYYDLR